jgi:hypothetical protein
MLARIELLPTDTLRAVRREWHTRKQGVYVIEDKQRQYLLLAQKLQALVSFLNDHVAPDASSRVSLTALYEVLNATGGRNEGWHKHRWRVRWVPLEEASALFERERGQFHRALILGEPQCYDIERTCA